MTDNVRVSDIIGTDINHGMPATEPESENETVDCHVEPEPEPVRWEYIPYADNDPNMLTENNIPHQRMGSSLYVSHPDFERIEEALDCKLLFHHGKVQRVNYNHSGIDSAIKETVNDVGKRFALAYRNLDMFEVTCEPRMVVGDLLLNKVRINFKSIEDEESISYDSITLGKTKLNTKKYKFLRNPETIVPGTVYISDGSENQAVLAHIGFRVVNITFEPDNITVRYQTALKRILRKALILCLDETIFQEQRFISSVTEADSSQYVDLCDTTRLNLIETLKNKQERIRREVENHSRQMREHLHNLTEVNTEMTCVENYEVAKDKYENDYNMIMANGKITKLSISNGHLKFITKTLSIQYIPIGKFLVDININTQSVKITNITKRLNYQSYYWDHPHVHSNIPCWGNIESAMLRQLADYELPVVVNMIIEYLESVNESDAYGKHFPEWRKSYEDRKHTHQFVV